MLSRFVLSGALLVGGAGGGILGQAATSAPFDWSSIVSGAVASSPAAAVLFWRLHKADSENQSQRAELKSMHDELVKTVREVVPALAESNRTLADVHAAMEATLDRAQQPNLEREMARLTGLVERLNRQGDR